MHVNDLPERVSASAASSRSVGDGSPVAEDDTVREVAVRRVAGGALLEIEEVGRLH
jgi:hypothetical protein